MNKAVFWDFDGTLVYANENFLNAMTQAMQRWGYAADPIQIRTFLRGACPWYTPERDYVDAVGDGWWTTMLSGVQTFCGKLGISEKDGAKIAADFRNYVLQFDYRVYEDAKETLAACLQKGYRNYLLSNNYPELSQVAARFGLLPYFTECFVSGCIGYEKPRPELFAYARERAGDPRICYMVGDNPVADIGGAQAAGMAAILVHRAPEDSHPDFCCASLAEIPNLLQ